MTTAMRHNVWVRANGQRAGKPLIRDAMDANAYGANHIRSVKPRGPVQVVRCSCGEQTIARSADAETLAGWTVDEWPGEPQEFGKVDGVCRKCAKRVIETIEEPK